MKTGILLSYKGLGANLLHLSYCHEIAKKFGPVTLITLNPKLNELLIDDPNFKEIIYLNKFHKKFSDIIQLSKFLKNLDLKNFFIFYPSLRYFLSSKIAGIKNIYDENDIKNLVEGFIRMENKKDLADKYIDILEGKT